MPKLLEIEKAWGIFMKKKLVQIMLVIIVGAIFINVIYLQYSVTALSKVGSTGNEVKQIQQKLKNWGYYDGSVDGVYGTQTKNAVVYFQQKNGLTADGIAGTATLSAMGIAAKSSSNNGQSSGDRYLLANVISAEARGEPYKGQVAVGAVILNRVKHPSFPKSIAGVCYQPGAFTAISDGQIKEAIADSAYRAADDALSGMDPSMGAIYYYNPTTATSAWIFSRPILVRIGKHVFCS